MAINIYCSPTGKDTNRGLTLSEPVQSPWRAQQIARQNAKLGDSVTVFFRGGRYHLHEGLVIDTRDQLSGAAKLTYTNYANELPIFSGGRQVDCWQRINSGLLRARIGWRIRQLYVNGRKAIRSRYPATGYFQMTNWYENPTADATQETKVANRVIMLKSENFAPVITRNFNNAELVVQRDWAQNRLRVKSVIAKGSGLAFVNFQAEEESAAFSSLYPYKYKGYCHFENALEFVTSPGQWFQSLDGDIYYYPRVGESASGLKAIAPRIETLIEVRGSLAGAVSNVEISGIQFCETNWIEPSDYGYIGFQGDAPVNAAPKGASLTADPKPAALKITYTSQVTVTRCRFQDTGANGIELAEGAIQTTVNGNLIRRMAASGIVMHGPIKESALTYPRPDSSNAAIWIRDYVGIAANAGSRCSNNIISNNLITDVGLDYPDGSAIFGAYVASTIINNNTIRRCPCMGISLGWGWADVLSDSTGNLLYYNDIGYVMQLLTDGGAIYHLGKSPSTQFFYNYLHHLEISQYAPRKAAGLVYLDAGSQGLLVDLNYYDNLTAVNTPPLDRVEPLFLNVPVVANTANPPLLSTTAGAQTIISQCGLLPQWKYLLSVP